MASASSKTPPATIATTATDAGTGGIGTRRNEHRLARHESARSVAPAGRRAPPWLLALLVACIVALVCGGCGRPPAKLANRTPSGELDDLTRTFADRYVGLLASACEALKKDNPDPVQHREAQRLLINCATNVYDIASNADAPTRVLDLVVVTTLVSQVWIDDGRAWDVFGDRAEGLVQALHHGRVEAWALAAQKLRPEQLDLMDYLLWDWRRRSPNMVEVSFVRLSNFAISRGQSANAEVLAASGLYANVGQAGQAVAEARLLTERMFYLGKRYPTLLRWQVDGAKDNIVATPDVRAYLADVERLTDQVQQLPKNVAAERQAILAAFDDRKREFSQVVEQVKGASPRRTRWPPPRNGPASRSTRCSRPPTAWSPGLTR